ncbi:MAG: septum formation initiator family protein [Candidatus Omnitrophota bacterium]
MLNSKTIFWVAGIILVILIIFLPGYTKFQELRDKNKDLETKISAIELENARLGDEILRIQQDPIFQEEVMRQKLGVVRKGEVVYQIVPEE